MHSTSPESSLPPERVAELLDAAIKGDKRASGILLLHSQSRLTGYIRKHLPAAIAHSVDPTDVVQDTFIQALRRISRFQSQGDDSFHRWLVAIARRQMLQLLRAHRTLKRGGSAVAVDQILQELALTLNTPSRSATRHEIALHIEACVQQLPAILEKAVRLRHLEQLPIKEVSKRLKRSEAATAMLCSRGLKNLRKMLGSMSRFR